MEIEHVIRYAPRAVGLMEIEHVIRYAPCAVGLKPPARDCEARLRGLWRIISSTTIRPRLCTAKPACAGYGGLFLQRPYALGYARRSPPARAMADYFFNDHTPSATQGEARLRGRERNSYSKTNENCYKASQALCYIVIHLSSTTDRLYLTLSIATVTIRRRLVRSLPACVHSITYQFYINANSEGEDTQ